MKDIRLKLPKRNPREGVQMALFEGYGFYDQILTNMQQCIERIDNLLLENVFVPLAKYGHAPSKWYLGNNAPAYGIIMHSREMRPDNKTGAEKFKVVKEMVTLCEELRITPKPEHKWIFSNDAKLERLQELREIVGTRFKPFIFDPDCDSILESMT